MNLNEWLRFTFMLMVTQDLVDAHQRIRRSLFWCAVATVFSAVALVITAVSRFISCW
jgi:uncharacterized membrane protein YhaH (DUF805 family)